MEELEHTTYFLRKWGFDTELITPPDQVYFGNWVLLATRAPLALRVINDRGVGVDLMEWDAFQAGAKESDWFNWDVVARALGIPVRDGEDQLWAFFLNLDAVAIAFLRPN